MLIGLIGFSAQELHELLNVGVHQINAHHLASVGPHADDKIYPGNTIDNQETTVVASDREPLEQFFICYYNILPSIRV